MIVFNLKSKIDRWVESGVISARQGEELLTLEAREGKSHASSAVLMLAAFLIGVGTISLIAANWHEIPDYLKLVLDYITLAALGIALFRKQDERRGRDYEGLLVAYSLFALATIGLNAQIFHLSGKWYEAGLLWSSLFLLTTFFSTKMFYPFVILGSFFISLHGVLLAPYSQSLDRSFAAIAYLIAILLSATALAARHWLGEKPITYSARLLVIYFGLFALFCAEVDRNHLFQPQLDRFPWHYALTWAFSLGIAASIFFSRAHRELQKRLLLASLAFFTTAMTLPMIPALPQVFHAASTILTLIVMSFFMASIGRWRSFNALLLLVGLRFVILYLQAFGGLAKTGFGMILSGLLLMGGIHVWRKNMPSLRAWAEEQLK